MNNRYLQMRDYARGGSRGRGGRDYRNPYGSRGGYVTTDRNDYVYEEDYEDEDYGMDYANDYARGGNRGGNRGGGRGGRDYNDYGHEIMDEREYEEELKKWSKKLAQKDRFGMSKDQVIQQAKKMNVDFKDFTEMEFYATYLMMISDYSDVISDPIILMKLAKKFLEDYDIEVSPSEKLYIYLNKIVKGK